MHEYKRPRNVNYMSDVYDSPRWAEVMGPCTARLQRIGLHYCVDGIPAFKPGGLSLKPAEFMILSLAPWERIKPENMLLHMLLPSKLKGESLKKYYDWAASYELNDLYTSGVEGVKVVQFGNTMDTPGRSELLAMKSSQSYQGCPHCFHSWEPGLVRKPVFWGARCFLPRGSPYRECECNIDEQTYIYKCKETRAKPATRTTQTAAECVSKIRGKKQVCGHKGVPMQSEWPAFSWFWSVCDWMHDIKCCCEMVLKTLVGPGSHGMYKPWQSRRYDTKHRAECKAYGIFPEVWDGTKPFPWRLSKEQLRILNDRVVNMWCPHYRDKLFKGKTSFWKKSMYCWKTKHKLNIFLVLLPTLLRGCVPVVHRALLRLIFALRRLDGLVVSIDEAIRLGICPGSHAFPKGTLEHVMKDLILGVVMLEGCFPITILNTTLHHILHFAEQTGMFGVLRWFWMFVFERYNKMIKGMVKNNHWAAESLARNALLQTGARFLDEKNLSHKAPPMYKLIGKGRVAR